MYGCVITPYSIFNSKRERVTWEFSQHLDLFQLFEHGKGNLINCIAHTLILIINATVGPTKMHFGERCPIHPPQICCKNFEFLTNWEIRCAFHDRNHRGRVGMPVHTIIAKIEKLLSRGLRPIFGGGERNNCDAICTSNVLRMITMMTIILARVCDLPRRGCVSMCMNQWWHIHIAFTHITTRRQRTLL